MTKEIECIKKLIREVDKNHKAKLKFLVPLDREFFYEVSAMCRRENDFNLDRDSQEFCQPPPDLIEMIP